MVAQTALLVTAALLLFGVGIAHSVLGERYILQRLFQRGNLPHLLGGETFTRQTLRFAWHLTTIAWWNLAAILLAIAFGQPDQLARAALLATSVGFAIHAGASFFGSAGRHLAWIVFAAVAVLTFIVLIRS